MRTALKCAIVAAIVLLVLPACTDDEQAIAPEDRKPENLAEEFEDKLDADNELSEYDIEVVVDRDKVLKMTGVVPDATLKEKAGRLAGTVAGVKSINNSLILSGERPEDRDFSDRQLRRELEKKIDADNELEIYPIDVEVDDARATITGSVSNDQERSKTMELAGTVTGFSEIRNKLRLSSEMADEFKAKVDADTQLRDYDISAKMTKGNQMTIVGQVPNDDYSDKAEELAETVCGVGDVDNEIDVREEMMVPPAPMLSDEQLRQELENKIAADTDLRDTDVMVQVQNGEAIIRGNVADRKNRKKIEKLAKTVEGITDVENKVELKPEKEVATSPWPNASARFVNDLL